MPWRPALVAAAIAAALVRLPPSIVERMYSAHVYTGVQPLLTSFSNLAPFALFDLLVLRLQARQAERALREKLDAARVRQGSGVAEQPTRSTSKD